MLYAVNICNFYLSTVPQYSWKQRINENKTSVFFKGLSPPTSAPSPALPCAVLGPRTRIHASLWYFRPPSSSPFRCHLLVLRSRGCFSRSFQGASFSLLRCPSMSPPQKDLPNQASWSTASSPLPDSSTFTSSSHSKLREITQLMYLFMACLTHKNIRTGGLSLGLACWMSPGPKRQYDIKYYRLTD